MDSYSVPVITSPYLRLQTSLLLRMFALVLERVFWRVRFNGVADRQSV